MAEDYPVGGILWIGDLNRYLAIIDIREVGRLELAKPDPMLRLFLEEHGSRGDGYLRGRVFGYDPLAGLDSGERVRCFDVGKLDERIKGDGGFRLLGKVRKVESAESERDAIERFADYASEDGNERDRRRAKVLENRLPKLCAVERYLKGCLKPRR